MQQTKDEDSEVECFPRGDGRVYLYDPAGVEAWIDAHEDDFVEVMR